MMRRWVPFLFFLLPMVCPAASSVGASPSNSGPTSQQTSNQVLVDVIVTDGAGQPVKGLHEQDFQVFEDKRRQIIRSVAASAGQRGHEDGQPAHLPVNTFTNATSFEPDTISVILLDQLNTSLEDQQLAREKVIAFLEHKPTGAAFAIFVLRNDDVACRPYDHARWSFGIMDTPPPDSDANCGSMGRLLMLSGITSNKDRLIAALNSNGARPHPTWLRVKIDGGGRDIYDRPSYGLLPADTYDTSMSALAELGHLLQNLPARKNLIWLSDDFDAAPIAQYLQIWFPPKFKGWEKTDPFSPTQMIHLATGRLTLARVALYLVDLTGKKGSFGVNRFCPIRSEVLANALYFKTPLPAQIPTRITSDSEGDCSEYFLKLGYVASQTGGKAFHGGEKVEEAMTQAASDESNYYTLAYLPANNKINGKIRNIKVTVAGKDYHLAYRARYYADDPSTLNRPETAGLPDVYVPNPTGTIPWKAFRVSDWNSSPSDDASEPILSALRYGAPESNEIVFSAHVEPTDKFEKATTAQMEKLQDYESFRTERIQAALQNLTKSEQKVQHKGRTTLDTLPAADPAYQQPYSIDYSLSGKQLGLAAGTNGEQGFQLEVAVLAFDALGKKVTGLKETVKGTVTAPLLENFRTSDYRVQQNLEIPDRVTLLRLAVRDLSSGRMGSLEIPVAAISSPYRRKQLEIAPTISDRGRK